MKHKIRFKKHKIGDLTIAMLLPFSNIESSFVTRLPSGENSLNQEEEGNDEKQVDIKCLLFCDIFQHHIHVVYKEKQRSSASSHNFKKFSPS